MQHKAPIESMHTQTHSVYFFLKYLQAPGLNVVTEQYLFEFKYNKSIVNRDNKLINSLKNLTMYFH